MNLADAERICAEAERAYFACFPQPVVITTVREETEAERLYREAWEGEYRPSRPDRVRALARVFDHFVVRRVQPGVRISASLAWQGDFYLEPVASEQAITGHTPLRPVFRREPIYDGGTNIGAASPFDNCRELFGPIPIHSAQPA